MLDTSTKTPCAPMDLGDTVRGFENAVQGVVRKFTRHLPPHVRASAAQDLAQEARIGVLKASRAHKSTKGALSTLAFTAMRRRVSDAMRGFRHPREVAGLDAADAETLNDEEMDVRNDVSSGEPEQEARLFALEIAGPIHQFLDGLTPEERAVVRAVFWDGHTQEVVAKARGVSQPRISAILRQIYTQGRKELAPLVG